MHGEIIQRAVTGGRLALPVEGLGGIGHEVLIHLGADMVDLADRAFVDQAADMADDGVLNVVVAHGRRFARPAGGIAHLYRIGKGGRHRLFAPDMLAGLKGGNGHFRVEGIRRGDRDDVDLGIGQQIAPVAGRAGKTELGRLFCCQFGIDFRQRHEARALHIAEDAGDIVPRERVAFAHVTRADKAHAKSGHGILLPRVL
ncbi:hypothetical protein D3C80_1394550 [compost metagenome]